MSNNNISSGNNNNNNIQLDPSSQRRVQMMMQMLSGNSNSGSSVPPPHHHQHHHPHHQLHNHHHHHHAHHHRHHQHHQHHHHHHQFRGGHHHHHHHHHHNHRQIHNNSNTALWGNKRPPKAQREQQKAIAHSMLDDLAAQNIDFAQSLLKDLRLYAYWIIVVVFRGHKQAFGFVDVDPPLAGSVEDVKKMHHEEIAKADANIRLRFPRADEKKKQNLLSEANQRILAKSLGSYDMLKEHVPHSEGNFVVVHSDDNSIDLGRIESVKRAGTPKECLVLPPILRRATQQEIVVFAQTRREEAERALQFLKLGQQRMALTAGGGGGGPNNKPVNQNDFMFGIQTDDNYNKMKFLQQQQQQQNRSPLDESLFKPLRLLRAEIQNCEFDFRHQKMSIYYKYTHVIDSAASSNPETKKKMLNLIGHPALDFVKVSSLLCAQFGVQKLYLFNVDDDGVVTETDTHKRGQNRMTLSPLHANFDWFPVITKAENMKGIIEEGGDEINVDDFNDVEEDAAAVGSGGVPTHHQRRRRRRSKSSASSDNNSSNFDSRSPTPTTASSSSFTRSSSSSSRSRSSTVSSSSSYSSNSSLQNSPTKKKVTTTNKKKSDEDDDDDDEHLVVLHDDDGENEDDMQQKQNNIAAGSRIRQREEEIITNTTNIGNGTNNTTTSSAMPMYCPPDQQQQFRRFVTTPPPRPANATSCLCNPPPLLVRNGKVYYRRAGANPCLFPPAFLVEFSSS